VMFWPSQFVIRYLTQTYFPGITLHAFGPADVILLELKFSIYAGIVLGLPVLLHQAWMFVVPAFHPKTRRLVYALIVPSVLLAALGIAFAHYIVIPRVVHALLGITSSLATATFGIGPTLNFVLILLLIFALIFQLPVILVGLARIGVISAAFLQRYRRHAFFAFFVIGGIAAPDGNPMTMALLALPMYVLFEVSIWVILLLGRSWKRAT